MTKLASAVLLVTWALLGLNALSGLCFGRDGHVALESLVAPHQRVAVVDGSDRESAASEVLSKQNSHGPCVDVPIEQISGTQIIDGKGYSSDVADAQASEADAVRVAAVLPIPSASSDDLAKSVGETSLLRSIRTTILRI